jgi:hypothetical protein
MNRFLQCGATGLGSVEPVEDCGWKRDSPTSVCPAEQTLFQSDLFSAPNVCVASVYV